MKASCPHCDQHYEIEPSHIGMVISCESCHKDFCVKVRNKVTPPAISHPVDDIGRRPCPTCGEMIAATAKKCRFCGMDFSAQEPKEACDASGNPRPDYGTYLILIPFVASGAAWLWITNISLINDPMGKLVMLSAVTVISTGILACKEYSNNPALPGIKKQSTSALFAMFILIWGIALPDYLYTRKRHLGLKNMVIGGIAASLFFCLVVGTLGFVIVTARNDIDQKIIESRQLINQSIERLRQTPQ